MLDYSQPPRLSQTKAAERWGGPPAGCVEREGACGWRRGEHEAGSSPPGHDTPPQHPITPNTSPQAHFCRAQIYGCPGGREGVGRGRSHHNPQQTSRQTLTPFTQHWSQSLPGLESSVCVCVCVCVCVSSCSMRACTCVHTHTQTHTHISSFQCEFGLFTSYCINKWSFV